MTVTLSYYQPDSVCFTRTKRQDDWHVKIGNSLDPQAIDLYRSVMR